MSEREKLRLAVCHAADIRPSDADAVIRLVVEACCAKLDAEAEDLAVMGDPDGLVYSIAADDLRSTFLPLPTPKENEPQ